MTSVSPQQLAHVIVRCTRDRHLGFHGPRPRCVGRVRGRTRGTVRPHPQPPVATCTHGTDVTSRRARRAQWQRTPPHATAPVIAHTNRSTRRNATKVHAHMHHKRSIQRLRQRLQACNIHMQFERAAWNTHAGESIGACGRTSTTGEHCSIAGDDVIPSPRSPEAIDGSTVGIRNGALTIPHGVNLCTDGSPTGIPN